MSNRIRGITSSDDEDRDIPLIDRFEINKCIEWIKTNNFSKVSLQFPDYFLKESVAVAFLIQDQVTNKPYILADTTYGSCCVDEIAAQHISSDGIIHFGHSCLTSTPRIPVLNVFRKRMMDFHQLELLVSELEEPTIILYDVGYHYLVDKIRKCFSGKDVIIPELLIGEEATKECSSSCKLKETGSHSEVRYSRGYCLPNGVLQKLIYIGEDTDPIFKNFTYLFRECEIWCCSFMSGLKKSNFLNAYKQISYFVEEIKASDFLTICVATMTMKGFLEAIEHVKKLAKKWEKKTYTISVGKPTVAKLSNFSQLGVVVLIGCTEIELPSRREIIQSVVSLLEVEIALNGNRRWEDTLTRDFRDLILGGQDYIPYGDFADSSGVSLISGKMTSLSTEEYNTSTDICIKDELPLVPLASSSLRTGGRQEKTWFGLKLSINDTPVALATKGRCGTSIRYEEDDI